MLNMSAESINFAGLIHKIFSYEPVLLNNILDQVFISVTKEEYFHTKHSHIRIVCSKKKHKKLINNPLLRADWMRGMCTELRKLS